MDTRPRRAGALQGLMRLPFVLALAVGLVALAGPVVTAEAAASPPRKVSASVSPSGPLQYTTVTVTAKVLNGSNRPIKGAKVLFSWRFKSGLWRSTKSTNAAGIATCPKPIGSAPAGYRVAVSAKATAAGKSVTGSTSFTPKAAPASGDITNAQLKDLVARGARLVDVRTPGEYVVTHIKGASNVPSDAVPTATVTWSKTAPVVVYCQSGLRSLNVATYLRSHGFTHVYNLAGGIAHWDGAVVPGMTPSGVVPATGRATMYDFWSPT